MLFYANSIEECRYHLCILLNHLRGATSYEALRTVRGEMLVRSSVLLPAMDLSTRQRLKHPTFKCLVHSSVSLQSLLFFSVLTYVNSGAITLTLCEKLPLVTSNAPVTDQVLQISQER
jgi:hypothetical protein